jgi:hypothetical protein
MSRELTSGASVPSTNKAEILAALNNVAAEYSVDPAAIAAIVDMESKWDTTAVTGRYIGLTQVGPELPREMGLTRAQFLALSAGKQIEAYGVWLNYYKFTKRFTAHRINVEMLPVSRQAAVLQGMQFAPNGDRWKAALAAGDLSVRTTTSQQARALGDTSIGDMERYYRGFFVGHPPVYA